MRSLQSATPLALLSILFLGCSSGTEPPAADVESAEDDITLAQCRKPSERNNATCKVTGVVVGGFIGEVDPFAVGDACALYVKELSSSKVWALVEDFDTCTATNAHHDHIGRFVSFHKGDTKYISSRAAREELKGMKANATFHFFAGAVSEVERPDTAFGLACKPSGDPCRRESSLGYCLDGIDVKQLANDRISVIIKTSQTNRGRRSPREIEIETPKSPSLGGRSDDSSLPETVGFRLEGGAWVDLSLDENDIDKMRGSFNWEEAVRFPGEFESLALTCQGSLE